MLNKVFFILAHQLGMPTFYRCYSKLMNNQKKTYNQLLSEQEFQLRSIIRYSYNNVPYYNRLFKKEKINPLDINTLEDLNKIPVLNKQIISKHWRAFIPINIDKQKYYNNSTGGTTGTPLNYRLSKNDRFLGGAMLYRGWSYAGFNLGDRMVFMGGASIDNTDQKSILYSSVINYLRNIRKFSSFDMSETNLLHYYYSIKKFKPKFIMGYASSIYNYANWIDTKGLTPHCFTAIFTTSDQLFPYMRDKIESVFSARVFDGYGLNDGGITAFECDEHNGYHIDMERSIMEIVNDEHIQTYNEEGKILATSLHNYSMPFLRYDTGDIGVLSDEKCSCNKPFPLLKEIHGRSVDVFCTPDGGVVHGWFFLYIFWKYNKGIIQYQVVQESLSKIVIYLVVNDLFEENQLNIIRQIIEEKSLNWTVEFKFVKNISTTATGKHKFIISKVITS